MRRNTLIPVLDGFELRDEGRDYRYICNNCKDEFLVDKAIAGDIGIPIVLQGHLCVPYLLKPKEET